MSETCETHNCEGKDCLSQAEYFLNLSERQDIYQCARKDIYLCEKCSNDVYVDYIHEDILNEACDCVDVSDDEYGVCSCQDNYKGRCEFCRASYNEEGFSCYISSIKLELCERCHDTKLKELPYRAIKENEPNTYVI